MGWGGVKISYHTGIPLYACSCSVAIHPFQWGGGGVKISYHTDIPLYACSCSVAIHSSQHPCLKQLHQKWNIHLENLPTDFGLPSLERKEDFPEVYFINEFLLQFRFDGNYVQVMIARCIWYSCAVRTYKKQSNINVSNGSKAKKSI